MTSSNTFDWRVSDAKTLVEEALTLDYFHPLEEVPEPDLGQTPIPAYFSPSGSDQKLIVIVGENASGKSFMRRIFSLICRNIKVECIPLSMQGRSDYFGGLRSMVYGDETTESTGVNSSRTVTTGIKTCAARTSPHVIIWDEPDLGLSENGAAGVGKAIADYMISPNEHTLAAIVITHSKPLVRRLVESYLHLNPHYLHLGEDNLEATPKSLNEWLAQGVEMRTLENIQEAGYRRFKLIQQILNKVKKKKA